MSTVEILIVFLPLWVLAPVLGWIFWPLTRPLVYLTDFQGEIRRGRLRRDRNGVFWTEVYPFTRVGHVVLLPGGVTSGESSYVRRWALAKPADATVEGRNARFVRAGEPA
jgi:hypothetical protein